MIGVDTNILVHAHRADSDTHGLARDAILQLAEGTATWTIPWPCLHEFLAIVTHPRIFSPPTPMSAACDQVEAWLECPSLTLIGEEDAHWETLRPLLEGGRITGPRVHDARVAALCLRHGVTEFLSADRDFSRFPRLRVRNPLVA